MEIIKEQTVCITGHRPEKLPSEPALSAIKSLLFYQIKLAADEGCRFFVSGLARGVDMWAADYILKLRQERPELRLICVQPFKEQGRYLSAEDRFDYNNILRLADRVICLADRYSEGCYKKRNFYMADISSRLIGVIADYRSGTGQTINYAEKKGLDVHIINVKDYLR